MCDRNFFVLLFATFLSSVFGLNRFVVSIEPPGFTGSSLDFSAIYNFTNLQPDDHPESYNYIFGDSIASFTSFSIVKSGYSGLPRNHMATPYVDTQKLQVKFSQPISAFRFESYESADLDFTLFNSQDRVIFDFRGGRDLVNQYVTHPNYNPKLPFRTTPLAIYVYDRWHENTISKIRMGRFGIVIIDSFGVGKPLKEDFDMVIEPEGYRDSLFKPTDGTEGFEDTYESPNYKRVFGDVTALFSNIDIQKGYGYAGMHAVTNLDGKNTLIEFDKEVQSFRLCSFDRLGYLNNNVIVRDSNNNIIYTLNSEQYELREDNYESIRRGHGYPYYRPKCYVLYDLKKRIAKINISCGNCDVVRFDDFAIGTYN